MALNAAQQAATARQIAHDLFVGPGVTATVHLGDILTAVQAVDAALDTTLTAAVAATNGATTILQFLNSVLPAPASGATVAQKIVLLTRVLDKRANII